MRCPGRLQYPGVADDKLLADAVLVAVIAHRGGRRMWAHPLRLPDEAAVIDLRENPGVTPLWTDRTSRSSWDREAPPPFDMDDTAPLLVSAPPSTVTGSYQQSYRSEPSAPSTVASSFQQSHRSRGGKHAEAMAEEKEHRPRDSLPVYSEGSSEAAKYYAAAAELIERARQTEAESQGAESQGRPIVDVVGEAR